MFISNDLPVDEKYPESCVYWIYHEDKHTDPKTSGYVGVSSRGMVSRFKQHKASAESGSKLKIHRAIRKYGDKIKVKILLKADPEFCLLVEAILRPTAQMGGQVWNTGSGGAVPTIGYKHQAATKAKMKERWKTRPPKSAETSARQSLAKTGRFAWRNNGAYLPCWAKAADYYSAIESGKTYAQAYRDIGLTQSNCARLKIKVDLGWNPNTDQDYLSWLSEYTKQQKESSEITPAI